MLGSLQPGAANVVVQFDISHAVFDEERLYALNEAAVKLNKKARIHIAIDTGMHRIGVHVRDAGEFAAKAAALRPENQRRSFRLRGLPLPRHVRKHQP